MQTWVPNEIPSMHASVSILRATRCQTRAHSSISRMGAGYDSLRDKARWHSMMDDVKAYH